MKKEKEKGEEYVCGVAKQRGKKEEEGNMDEKKRVKKQGKNKIKNEKLKLRNVITIFSQYFHNKF